ncbi:MAG: PH domain-containing protein [Pyrinomonadaceae bacterium]
MGTVLLAIFIPLTLGAFFILVGGANRETGRSLLVIGTVTGAVVIWLTYPLYYQITASELIVRCGMLMRRRIPLASIDEVRPDRNPASAPAWSLDRLRVGYRKRGESTFVMISPEDKSAFMRELSKSRP